MRHQQCLRIVAGAVLADEVNVNAVNFGSEMGKALKLGLKPIVVLNKTDRPDARPDEVHEEVFDLLASLDASEEQLDFPVIYASAKNGWASLTLDGPREEIAPLLDLIVERVDVAAGDPEAPFAMLATILEYDSFLGRVVTGRIHSGRLRANMTAKVLTIDGEEIETTRLTKLLAFRGLERVPLESAEAGDIVAIAGLDKATVAHTICDPSVDTPIAAQPVDPPTLAVTFTVNDSPLAGRDGDKVTSRLLRARLLREAEGNVAIRVREADRKDSFEVAGRGELQIGVLIETMRREGFELAISRPRVLFQKDPDTGKDLEPIEEVVIDVDSDYAGVVVEKMSQRKAELAEMKPTAGGKHRLGFLAPSRGLIGYHGEFLTDTRGTGVMNRVFHSFAPHKGPIGNYRNGVLISMDDGKAVPFALWNLEERGVLFIEPGVDVYRGMIIGEHSRGNDLDVNPLKSKQLTNIRAAGKDDAVRLSPPRRMSLEEAVAYIGDDELVEVTPKAIRLRKKLREIHERKKAMRAAS
ncbi:MAG: EF-Tu/IF-2/RF-3 family GTPase [Alphaproteobacteria bacterium]